MKKSRALADALSDAGLLIDSGEIAHVIELLKEDTALLVGDFLSDADSARLTACGPAAMIADRIRKTIRSCFPTGAPWPLETAKEINSAGYWYSRYQHGECLIEALGLAHYAASYGLGELDLWRLRARLEQLTSMALFALPGAPSAQTLANDAFRALQSSGGVKSGVARRSANAARDKWICEQARQLLSGGKTEREVSGIIKADARADGLSAKSILNILRQGSVISPPKKRGS